MTYLDHLMSFKPYALRSNDKSKIIQKVIHYLTRHHFNNCKDYRNLIKDFDLKKQNFLENYPYISSRLFKKYDLYSTSKKEIIKILNSSGTTGSNVSKIYLDSRTSRNQIKVLSKIICEFLGQNRLPMLIIDTQQSIKNRKLFNARGAGILGFSIFGKNVTYVLDENMNVDFNVLEVFLKKYNIQDFLVFGFTSIIWQFFVNQILTKKIKFNFKNAILFHGGGWKKLSGININNTSFKNILKKEYKINRIHNYYGMIEQTGSIFLECEKGFFHTSNFSDIIIRDNHFNNIGIGKKGIVQLISCLPYSYPGHNIITEDEGEIIDEDNCKCGRMGKYFIIHGRVAESELRGCSDTY